MDKIIIRTHGGATPERLPPPKDFAPPILPMLSAEVRTQPTGPKPPSPPRPTPPGGVYEGDIVPNPNMDVDTARANVARAYGGPEVLK